MLKEVIEKKQRLIKLVEHKATPSIVVAPEEAALMWAIPRKILQESGITVMPAKKEQVKIVVGSNHEQHLENLGEWLCRGDKSRQDLRKKGYKLLFLLGQASHNQLEGIADIIEARYPELEVMEMVVPGMKELKDHLAAGGYLTREDMREICAQARGIFNSLGHDCQEDLKKGGFDPDNIMQASSE
jgi:hypothetical protein